MDQNGSLDSLDSIIVGLKTMLKTLQAREDEARAVLEAAQVETKKVKQMIRAAEGTGMYGPKTERKRSNTLVAEENLELYWQRLQTQKFERFDIPGGFSAKDVASTLGVHKSTSDRIIRTLREQDRIRLAGERYPDDNKTHTGKPHAVYVING